jgi:sigma-E factor negative regulatory protein RseC
MLETTAKVVRTGDGRLWVETRPRSACSGCSSDNCSTAVVSKLFGSRRNRFPLETGCDLKPGERVLIDISDDLLVRASVWAYLVPLLVMILVAALAGALGVGEGWQSLCAIGGLALGFVLVRRISCSKSSQQRLKPRLRRVE